MKMYSNPLRAKLKNRATTYGLWVTMESATVTELCAELGIDWVCLDLEHGALDLKDVVAHSRAARGSDMAVLARVPAISIDHIKRCLDLGVDGVLLPLVRSASDLEMGLQFGRYPPRGVRGIGGERSVRWGLGLQEYLATANAETMIIPLIETVDASGSFQEILDVPGLEAVFFGPADHSASLGYLGEWEGPGVAEDILRMLEIAGQKGIASGIVGMDASDVAKRASQGFAMVALGSDVGMVSRQVKPLLAELKGKSYSGRWF